MILNWWTKKVKISSDYPFNRTVTKEMNLMGICENKNCLAYKKQIVHMFGFGITYYTNCL